MYGTISTTYHCVCFPNYRSGCVDLATECLPPSECPNLPPHTHHTSRCRLLELGSNSKSNNRIHSYLNTQSNSSVIGPRRLSRPPALHVIRPTGRPIHTQIRVYTWIYMHQHVWTCQHSSLAAWVWRDVTRVCFTGLLSTIRPFQ